MISVVIADDNRRSCEGIRNIITSNFPELEIRGVFHNGLDLQEYLRSNSVNIVITDIHMHGLDGLEACKGTVRQGTEIIAITGYQLFEYAKRAIDYHIPHFIVKPYTSEILISAISTCIRSLDSRRQEQQKGTAHYLAKWQFLKSHAQSILQGNSQGLSALSSADLFCNTTSLGSAPCSLITFQSDISRFAERFDHDSPLVVAFIFDSEGLIFYKSQSSLQNYLLDIAGLYLEETGLPLSYSLKYFESLVHVSTERTMRLFFSQYIKDALISFAPVNGDLLQPLSLQQLRCLADLCAEQEPNIGKLPGFSVTDRQALIDFFTALPDVLSQQSRQGKIASIALQLIAENYSDPGFSLSNIASKLGISYTYLSKVFKNTYNITLLNYLTDYRLEQAKRLLHTTDKSISDISRMVGYLKASHFRHLFLEKHHITPSDYRIQSRSIKNGT